MASMQMWENFLKMMTYLLSAISFVHTHRQYNVILVQDTG